MESSKRGNIPMQEKPNLSKAQGAKKPDEVKCMQRVPYASAIRFIMYETDVKTILKYLRNTKDTVLVYGRNLENGPSCYTDDGFHTDKNDTKSQSGYVFVLNGGVADWKSAKQRTIAMSSTKAEYIVALEALMEVVWMRKFIDGLGSVVPTYIEPMKMLCDNTGAIDIANNPKIMKGTRHYQRKYHYIQKVIKNGNSVLNKVHTDDNVVDLFTKPMSLSNHNQHVLGIGLCRASSLMFGFHTHHACSIAFVVHLLIAKRLLDNKFQQYGCRGGRGETSGGTTESGASRGNANNGRRGDERYVVSRGQSSALQNKGILKELIKKILKDKDKRRNVSTKMINLNKIEIANKSAEETVSEAPKRNGKRERPEELQMRDL
ncbi:hypothetical protein Tco_0686366 [Tanacetum coccineum]